MPRRLSSETRRAARNAAGIVPGYSAFRGATNAIGAAVRSAQAGLGLEPKMRRQTPAEHARDAAINERFRARPSAPLPAPRSPRR